MGVTIKDVARKTGVSVTTVSLVLNKKSSRISEKTRQLIEDAAKELHYIPNHNAVSLVTKKSRLIAMIIPADTYYQYDDFIRSMEYACRNAGYYLNISLAEHTPEDIEKQIMDILRYNVEGIIFDSSMLVESSDSLYQLIAQQDIPVIFTNQIGDTAPENGIIPAHRKAASLAADHLISLGHTRIGLVTGPENLRVTGELIAGYRSTLEECHIPFSEDLIYCGSYNTRTGDEGLIQLMKENVSAIICASDMLACGVLRSASKQGINIPSDLSLVSYGMGSFIDTLGLPITSISVHLDRIARKSVNLIRNYHGEPSSPELIEPTLIDRGSTAPYNKNL